MPGDLPVTIFAEKFATAELTLPPGSEKTLKPDSQAAPIFGRNLSDAFVAVRKYHQKNASEKLEFKKLRPRYYFTDPKLQSANATGKSVHGDVLLQRIRYYLANMPVERSEDQKKFHEEFLRAVAPGLYGPSFEIEYKRVLQQNGWESVRPQAMVITPRRWGKTYCTAMFVAAYLLAVPNAVQCVFSTSARVSQMFLELVYRFFIAFPGADKRIAKYTPETLWIRVIYSFYEKGDTHRETILGTFARFFRILLMKKYGRLY